MIEIPYFLTQGSFKTTIGPTSATKLPTIYNMRRIKVHPFLCSATLWNLKSREEQIISEYQYAVVDSMSIATIAKHLSIYIYTIHSGRERVKREERGALSPQNIGRGWDVI